MYQACSSSSTIIDTERFYLNLGTVNENDKGLHYSDLPSEVNRLFHQKNFSKYFHKTFLSESSILHKTSRVKILTYVCHYLNICLFGIFGLGFFTTNQNQTATNFYLLGRKGFYVSQKIMAFILVYQAKLEYIEEHNNKLISCTILKQLFDYIPENLIMKLNCRQFSCILKKFPFTIDELRRENKLSEDKSYLLKKIPMIRHLTREAFKKCSRSWDLFAEINRHPILIDALKCNLRRKLRKDPKIQRRLNQLKYEQDTLFPPPIMNATLYPNYKEARQEAPIPLEKLYGFLMYYLNNIEDIKLCQPSYFPIINSLECLMRDSKGEIVFGTMLYSRIIQSLFRSLFYSKFPLHTYENILAFLQTFGMEKFDLCVIDMCFEEFSKQLLVDDVIVLNRLLGLIPIIDRVDNDNCIDILKNDLVIKLNSKEVLREYWDKAEKGNLEHLKNYIISFCIEHPEIAEETWLAVPREIRAYGFESRRRMMRSSPRMTNLSQILNG